MSRPRFNVGIAYLLPVKLSRRTFLLLPVKSVHSRETKQHSSRRGAAQLVSTDLEFVPWPGFHGFQSIDRYLPWIEQINHFPALDMMDITPAMRRQFWFREQFSRFYPRFFFKINWEKLRLLSLKKNRYLLFILYFYILILKSKMKNKNRLYYDC